MIPRPRVLFALGATLPLLAVTVAVILSQFYSVAACPLCIVQRMLYLALIALFFCGFCVEHVAARVVLALLASLCASIGAALAGYQIYLQHHPFSTCGNGTSWWEIMVENTGNALPLLFKANGLCSDATQLLGLSIVEWSLLGFCGLFLLSMLSAWASVSSSKIRS